MSTASQMRSPATDIEPIQANGFGMIYWVAIPYDGADVSTSRPITGAGLTFDARLVYTTAGTYDGGPSPKLVVGRKSPGEVELALIPTGREIIESAPPSGLLASKSLSRKSVTSSDRRRAASARSRSCRATRACQTVAARPPIREATATAQRNTSVRCRRTNFPVR